MISKEFIIELKRISISIEFLERCVIILFIILTYSKLTNSIKIDKKKKILIVLLTPVISITTLVIKYTISATYNLFIVFLFITIICVLLYKKDVSYSFIITLISMGINYAIYTLALFLAFFPVGMFRINNDYINLLIITIIYSVLLYYFSRIKKLKYGMSFLQNKLETNTYVSLFLMNICTIILFLVVIIQTVIINNILQIGTMLLLFFIYMFIMIKEAYEMYYKHNQLVKSLSSLEKENQELKDENKKIKEENINFSKTSHSLNHRIKALEFKMKKEYAGNISMAKELEEISKQVYKEPENVEIPETNVENIDNMLKYMQSECIKNNIKFDLQICGNIYYMVNHLISTSDLEIILADHIKDAIIAINSSENLNRSILVKLGKIDNIYSIFIYDSGIEFPNEIVKKLGKEPVTTHKDTGGTGMGYMNTFDVLKKSKASLIIKDLGKPTIDNYTKAIIIKFDNKNDFKKIDD